MKIDLVQCLLRLNQGGNTHLLIIPRAGPDAVPVTEIPILRELHEPGEGEGECCISEAILVGSYEASRAAEIERLKEKYRSGVVDMIYPGGRGMPSTIEDCEIPGSSFANVPSPAKQEVAVADGG